MRVLRALASEPSGWRYGYELGVETGLKAGSLYPILVRLADRGLLEATWEASPPQGRPPRHLYRLTSDGQELAASAVPAPVPDIPAPDTPAAKTRRQRLGQPRLDGA